MSSIGAQSYNGSVGIALRGVRKAAGGIFVLEHIFALSYSL